MAKFTTNASEVMLLLNLIHVTESISGSVVPLPMFIHKYVTKTQCLARIPMDAFRSSFLTKSLLVKAFPL